MKQRPTPPEVDLKTWARDPSAHSRNRSILEWLSHDQRRAELYAAIREQGGLLRVPSLARADELDPRPATGAELQGEVVLVAGPEHVQSALLDGKRFSNLPYRRLGSGEFLLGLDPGIGDSQIHTQQADALRRAFARLPRPELLALARWSAEAAATASFGRSRLDAASYAESAGLRFVQALFGFARSDIVMLRDSLRLAYRSMMVQMMARHFASDPLAVPQGRAGMARIAARCSELMRDHALQMPDWPDGLEDSSPVPPERSVLRSLALDPGPLPPHARAVLAVGALAGTVANIQAATCIALEAWLQNPEQLAAARAALAPPASGTRPDPTTALWADHVAPALRRNPAAPFLPRLATGETPWAGWPREADGILLVGSATAAVRDPRLADALVFGLDPGPQADGVPYGLHYCLGTHLAQAVVCHALAALLRLPGLEHALDDDGVPIGLVKRYGFGCESLPLTYRRDLYIRQQPLNVTMRVRHPVDLHGEALREVLRSGAHRIEQLLSQSRHVHFAWFEFIDDGHALTLHTVFDGDFDAYLQHFAVEAGDLFDELFVHLESPPPMPVKDNPEAFARHIRGLHRSAAEGYFFSAYRQGDTATVRRALARLGKDDPS